LDLGGDTTATASALIDNLKFNSEQISKLFGVPIGLLTGEGNLDNMYQIFVVEAVRPVAEEIEQRLINLLPLEYRDDTYFSFDYDSVIRTDKSKLIDIYVKEFNNGILSLNEIRHKLDLQKIDGEVGNYHFISSALLPMKKEQID